MTKFEFTAWCLGAFGGTIAFVLMQGPDALSNLGKLPGVYSSTLDELKSTYYQDKFWTGTWSANTEYWYDSGAHNISNTDIVLQLGVEKGKARGSIYTKNLCDTIPLLDMLFLDGYVGLDREVHLKGYEMIHGERVNFASFDVRIDNDKDKAVDIITVKPSGAPSTIFPDAIRLTRQSENSEEYKEPFEYCFDKRKNFILDAIRQREKKSAAGSAENIAPRAK